MPPPADIVKVAIEWPGAFPKLMEIDQVSACVCVLGQCLCVNKFFSVCVCLHLCLLRGTHYVSVSACVVKGVFYNGRNPLPLLLLNVFDVFSCFF